MFDVAAAWEPLPGLRVGRYELLRRINVGGMAEVFLARAVGAEGFSRLVVVKTILPQHAGNDESVRMLLDEARLLGRLHHPHVVQVFDAGVFRGRPYLAVL